MYYLKDLNKHEAAIKQADIVLVSAGLNDLTFNKVSPTVLAGHMQHFANHCRQHYPRTKILFDSICPIALHADPYNNRNWNINDLNYRLFEYSRYANNFKLFDTPKFSVAHLGRDGIHLNTQGKRVLSDSWVHCTLVHLGLRSGSLPLRREYMNRLAG